MAYWLGAVSWAGWVGLASALLRASLGSFGEFLSLFIVGAFLGVNFPYFWFGWQSSFCRYLSSVRSWGLILHTFSKLGRAVFVAIYLSWVRSWGLIFHSFGKDDRAVFVAICRGCAPGG